MPEKASPKWELLDTFPQAFPTVSCDFPHLKLLYCGWINIFLEYFRNWDMSCFSSSFLYFYVGNIFFNCIYPIFLHPIWIIHQKEDVFIEMHEAGAADGRAKHMGNFQQMGNFSRARFPY